MIDPYTACHPLSPSVSGLFVLVHSGAPLSGVLKSWYFPFILIFVWGPNIGFWLGACTLDAYPPLTPLPQAQTHFIRSYSNSQQTNAELGLISNYVTMEDKGAKKFVRVNMAIG
jgi:hypothetical protein